MAKLTNKQNLNTSHVNVNHFSISLIKNVISYLNTSHVNVNQTILSI